jgi:hypothetical protein
MHNFDVVALFTKFRRLDEGYPFGSMSVSALQSLPLLLTGERGSIIQPDDQTIVLGR